MAQKRSWCSLAIAYCNKWFFLISLSVSNHSTASTAIRRKKEHFPRVIRPIIWPIIKQSGRCFCGFHGGVRPWRHRWRHVQWCSSNHSRQRGDFQAAAAAAATAGARGRAGAVAFDPTLHPASPINDTSPQPSGLTVTNEKRHLPVPPPFPRNMPGPRT